MHCPSCGQQQVSTEIKFCSKCGFPMGLVSELLAHGGFLPQLAELHEKKKSFWMRRNGIFLSVLWVMLCWFLMAPLFALGGSEEGAAFFGMLGFFGGLFGTLVSLFFLPSSQRQAQFQPQSMPAQMPQMPHQNAQQLPPQQSIPVEDYIQPGHWKAPDTGQFAQPGSVTDSTTKLLERDTK